MATEISLFPFFQTWILYDDVLAPLQFFACFIPFGLNTIECQIKRILRILTSLMWCISCWNDVGAGYYITQDQFKPVNQRDISKGVTRFPVSLEVTVFQEVKVHTSWEIKVPSQIQISDAASTECGMSLFL